MNRLNDRYLLLVAVVTLLTFVVALVIAFRSERGEYFDPDGWGQLGFRIAEGKGLTDSKDNPSAFRGPVTPLAFAVSCLVYEKSYDTLLVTQCLFFALANGLIGVIAQRIFGDWRVTVLTMLIYLGYTPAHPWFANIFSEPAFTFTVALFVLTWMVALEKGGGWWLLAGVTLALSALCRPPMYFFVPFVLLHLVMREGIKARAFRLGALVVVGFLLLEVPWVVRNQVSVGKPVLMTSGGNQAWFKATWYQAANWTGNCYHDEVLFPQVKEGFWQLPTEKQDEIFLELAKENVRTAPVQVALLVPKRAWMFLFQLKETGWMPTPKSLLLGGTLYLLAILGYYFASVAQRARYSPCLWVFVFNWLFHAALVCEFRCSHPVQPYVFMLSSSAVVVLADRFLRARQPREARHAEHALQAEARHAEHAPQVHS